MSGRVVYFRVSSNSTRFKMKQNQKNQVCLVHFFLVRRTECCFYDARTQKLVKLMVPVTANTLGSDLGFESIPRYNMGFPLLDA